MHGSMCDVTCQECGQHVDAARNYRLAVKRQLVLENAIADAIRHLNDGKVIQADRLLREAIGYEE